MTQPQAILDLHRLPEDDRIKLIGNSLMQAHKRSDGQPVVSGVVVDTQEIADRYIKKLAELFPGIVVKEKSAGLHTVVIKLVRKDELH